MDNKAKFFVAALTVITLMLVIGILGTTKNLPFSSKNPFGNTIKNNCYEIANAIQTIESECENLNDEGISIFRAGKVIYNDPVEGEKTLVEECTKEGNLIEYDCTDGKVSIYVVKCSNGCKDGACNVCE